MIARLRETEIPSGHAGLAAFYAFRTRVIDELVDDIRNVVIPIFGRLGDDIHQDRTGVLLQIGHEHFVVTAAHDLADWVRNGVFPYTSPAEDLSTPLQLVVERCCVVTKHDCDIAVLQLTADCAYELKRVKRFLHLHEVARVTEMRPTYYMVYGYPHALCRRVEADTIHVAQHWIYITTPCDNVHDLPGEYNPRLHLLVDYTPEMYKSDGSLTETPKAHGLSGAGIWQLSFRSIDIETLESWQPSEARLIAVQHKWNRTKHYLKATWMKHVLDIIGNAFPDLRPALTLSHFTPD